MNKKRVIVSVTNDLSTDQRVDRTCRTLVKMGFEVLLVGRKRRVSRPLASRTYPMHRMKLFFDKGALFYAEYNIRLFFYLLSHKPDLLVSNDLDTLLANYLYSILPLPRGGGACPGLPGGRGVGVVHDCHEYFRGVPELIGRNRVTAIWKGIEDRIFPKLKHVVAVNQSIAGIYTKEYGNPIRVIRNVPDHKPPEGAFDKASLGILPEQKVILYQGAVNVDRGLEEAILAMEYLKTDAVFLILGTGDIFEKLKILIRQKDLGQKVIMPGPIPLETLHRYTLMGDIGLSIEKNVCINYYYALPNKFMDYIQARVPVLVSPFPEMKAIVEQYGIGEYIENHDPAWLASKLDSMLADEERLGRYRRNLAGAALDLCWEKEEEKLKEIFSEKI